MSRHIAVFGATGRAGSEATRSLIEAGLIVTAVTRDPSSVQSKALKSLGAQVVAADLDDRTTLRTVIEKVDTLYFSGPSLANRWDIGQAAQGINVADAAAEAGIGHFIFQSALIGNARGVLGMGSKRAVEERLAELELPTTIVRPGLFMENFITHTPPVNNDGTLLLAAALPADCPQGMISTVDIGKAAARIAADPAANIGREIDLIAETLTLAQMAEILGEVSGKPSKPISVPLDALQAEWPQGIPLYRWLGTREDNDDKEALGKLIGEPLKFRQWVRDYLLPNLK